MRSLKISFQTTDKQRHPSEVLVSYGETSRFCEEEGEEEGKEKDMDFSTLTDGKALRAIIVNFWSTKLSNQSSRPVPIFHNFPSNFNPNTHFAQVDPD